MVLRTEDPAGSATEFGAFPTARYRARERSALSLLRHSVVQTQRLVLRWARDPVTMAQAVVYPALLLIMLNIVLGKQISSFSGVSALYGSVPMTALVGVMSGSVAGAVTMGRERDSGLLARLWVLPVHRASGLVSRILSEVARILVSTVAVLVTGYLLGFRFDRGIGAALVFVAVPILFGIGFATMVTAVALYTAKATLVETISIASSLFMFFSTGFVPLAAYPKWIQPFVAHQPLTCAIDTMRGLSLGGPVRGPLLATVAWSVGAMVAFAVPAWIGYRRASRG